MSKKESTAARLARYEILGVFLIPALALITSLLTAIPGKRLAAIPENTAKERKIFSDCRRQIDAYYSKQGRYPISLESLDLLNPNNPGGSLRKKLEYAAADKIYELRLMTSSGEVLYACESAPWGSRQHVLQRRGPNEIEEMLHEPVQIREMTSRGLITEHGELIEIPYVREIPADSDLLKDAVARGVEVDRAGHVYGLILIHHWCGNDPIRKHISRVNLSALLLRTGSEVGPDAPRNLRKAIDVQLGRAFGMPLPPLIYSEFGLWPSSSYDITYLENMLRRDADYGIVPLHALVRDRSTLVSYSSIPCVVSLTQILAGRWQFFLNPSLWLLLLHPAIVFLLAFRRKWQHPILIACLLSVLLSWVFGIGTVLGEDIILERMGLQARSDLSVQAFIIGGEHGLVGSFGWTFSLVLIPLCFALLFLPWLIKTNRITVWKPWAFPPNIVTPLTPAHPIVSNYQG